MRPCMDHGAGWLSGMSACGPRRAVPQHDSTAHQRRCLSRSTNRTAMLQSGHCSHIISRPHTTSPPPNILQCCVVRDAAHWQHWVINHSQQGAWNASTFTKLDRGALTRHAAWWLSCLFNIFVWFWMKCDVNLQEWKIINNFHVRVRRRNKVTGKYVSTVSADNRR